MLFCPDSDDKFSICFILHNPFSLPCVFLCASPWFLLPSCCFFCLVGYFFPSDCRKLFTGEKAKGEDASQWLSKISIFPFIEDFPSSLPTVLEIIRWDSYCLVSTAQPAVGRRRTTGWLCHMPYQLVLDTEKQKLLWHPLTLHLAYEILGQNLCNWHSKSSLLIKTKTLYTFKEIVMCNWLFLICWL